LKIYLLRHSTLIITFAGLNILVDPMLGAAQSSDPIANSANPRRNPLVELPFDENTLVEHLETLDGIIVTHTHNDHWDAKARELLPKSLPLFCQPEDHLKIQAAGFQAVQPVFDFYDWHPVQIVRTGGQHGRGKIGELMAPVSGFVLKAAKEVTVYIAGDTLWCAEVQRAIDRHKPEVIIANAGAAQFTSGGPITMTSDDVIALSNAIPEAIVIVVHMEAINHCLLSRGDLMDALNAAGVSSQVRIPEDGVQITIEN
jgi:L-ascorbate metabolism protein UlaG (beta-lactamase superfamily)